MSVTVSDLLCLPSLRQAKVLGGSRGLSKIVSSISVLESTDPDILVNGLFPQGEFFGSEMVITGFLNITDDVERQCANIRQLAEGGEAGLILFYVGVYMPRVDKQLIDLANEMDFVLICMPEGDKNLRYGEVICDVMDCIYRDRARNESIVSEILARVSGLPVHLQSVNTILKMVSDRISASVVLCDSSMRILNLVAWPRNLEDTVKRGMEKLKTYPRDGESQRCAFLPDGKISGFSIQLERGGKLELFLIKEGVPLTEAMSEQVKDVVRLGMNIWGQQHSEVAIHELVHAILQDEPMKMRRLADIFHIHVAAIHEMWILDGEKEDFAKYIKQEIQMLRIFADNCADIVVADVYDDKLLLFLSTPYSLKDARQQIEGLLRQANEVDETTNLTRCSGLRDTKDVRKAYLCHQDYLSDARKIFPGRRHFQIGDIKFAQSCHQLIDSGEQNVEECLKILSDLQTDNEELRLIDTLSTYLLDGESSVTKTSELLYLHKNTIKYRIQRMSDILGYRPDKMPECMELYQAVAVQRLLGTR